jgi:4a-hydroxytetrahydrobiopterin dehydratase
MLETKNCVPCSSGTPKLEGQALEDLRREIGADWKIIDGHHLQRQFKFKDFKEALRFTNKVGEIAEAENHHPDILLTWGLVEVKIWTHKIDGLSENDFILARKIDDLPGPKA